MALPIIEKRYKIGEEVYFIDRHDEVLSFDLNNQTHFIKRIADYAKCGTVVGIKEEINDKGTVELYYIIQWHQGDYDYQNSFDYRFVNNKSADAVVEQVYEKFLKYICDMTGGDLTDDRY